MDSQAKYITYIVVASSVIVLLLIAMVVDLIMLYRNRKRLADQQVELHNRRIDAILKQQEIDSVNSILKGQSEERRRIAQDLHDRLGSLLFTAKLHYSRVEKSLKEIKDQTLSSNESMTKILDEAVDEVRRISHDLYESSLEKFGFRAAMGQLLDAITSSNPIEIVFNYSDSMESVNAEIEKALYRISQELLSNTLKHSEGASKGEITLNVENEEIVYRYADNGRGFNLEDESKEGIGIESVKSRAKSLGGEYSFQSLPGSGMSFTLKIPLLDEAN